VWLKLPRSVCLPAQECLTSPSISLLEELARSCAWRGKSLRPESWRRVMKTGVFQTLLSGLTCEPSTANRLMAEWTASLEGFRAPISVSQDGKQDSTGKPADSFSSTCESFAKFAHDGSLLRTSRQFLLFQQEEPFLENLPRSGSMRSGALFERPMLAPRIGATGLSSWHTPRANECEEGAETFVKRNGVGRDKSGGVDLQAQVASFAATLSTQPPDDTVALIAKEMVWPTPAARDHKSPNGESHFDRSSGAKHLDQLSNFACHSFPQAQETPPLGSESSPSSQTSRRRLNPNFVDWLMSLLPGWTDYAPVETELWFCKVRMHLRSLLEEQGFYNEEVL
jgi:hypothetical protein